MSITHTDLDHNLRHIKLGGRLDIPGTDAISVQFTALAATSPMRVVVDLREVSFISSIGIRAIIMNAKALQQRGGKMALLLGNEPAIVKALEITGVGALIPICKKLEDAANATS